ncbi:MAG: hypothetical protein HYU37_14880 [Acidobacteria bacterium]|nr:hypothetical protein [Acidobacteriota bacterium]
MLISVVNHTAGRVKDEDVQVAIRAINRQISHDFEPYWNISAELRLEGPVTKRPARVTLPELRGEAVIYLWDRTDPDGALGYHEANARGIPFGFIFMDLTEELEEPWTVTLSHEALELIGDPEVNLLVAGPHPSDGRRQVFHWFEMCDAVQAETYKVDGVDVSNFVLPLYFTRDAEPGSRNDFLGRWYNGRALASFGINSGGYIGFFNPKTRKHETFALQGDEQAKRRLKIKSKAQRTRRSVRYRSIYSPRRAAADRRRQKAAAMPRVEQIKSSVRRSGPGVD